MELREIEIFLTLAEELHFGRTAQRLHVSQARVSQAIKKQERRIGAPLFERTSRTVRLTAVGEQLRNDLGPIYQALKDSMERAGRAARGKSAMLRVGMIPSNAHDLRPVWEAFRARHPQWELRVRHAPFIEPFEGLRRGEIDVLVSWLPVEEPDLTVGPVVFTEPRVLLVAPGNELADRASVSLEILGDHGVLGSTVRLPEYFEDAFVPFFTPSGRQISRHVEPIFDLDGLYTAVSSGDAIHNLAAHVTRYHVRPDIVYIPIHDAPHIRWALVWRADSECELVRALAQVVKDLGTAEL